MSNAVMEFLEFTFGGFWHFWGVVLLLGVLESLIYSTLKGISYVIHGYKIVVKEDNEDEQSDSEIESVD